MAHPRKLYIVLRGYKTGIFDTWLGKDGAEVQILNYPGACYKSFKTLAEAQLWVEEMGEPDFLQQFVNPKVHEKTLPVAPLKQEYQEKEPATQTAAPEEAVVIYTDGSALSNPGPGGYGVVLRYKEYYKELSGGYRLTTNNRMEILACIKGLQALKTSRPVILYSDSQYVINSLTKGWAKRWRKKGWVRTGNQLAENADLWEQLLDLCARFQITFKWIRGHSGNPDNERCDTLATHAAKESAKQRDVAYETHTTKKNNIVSDVEKN